MRNRLVCENEVICNRDYLTGNLFTEYSDKIIINAIAVAEPVQEKSITIDSYGLLLHE